MDINLNVNINAPELCASINNLATALVMQKTTTVTGAINTPADKSNFTFKLADTAVTDKPEPNVNADKVETVTVHNAETVELPTTGRTDDATQVEKPAADQTEPTKEESQKVELEVIRGILKSKVEAGKKAEVAAFLASYGVKKLTDIPADNFNAEMQAKAEAI